MDGLEGWLACLAGLLVVRVLMAERVGGPLRQRLRPVLHRVADRLTPAPALDPELAALSARLRRQRLEADVERLRRLLTHDEAMPGTRQRGNRIAYQDLLAELAAAPPDPVDPVPRTQLPLTPDPTWTTGPDGAAVELLRIAPHPRRERPTCRLKLG